MQAKNFNRSSTPASSAGPLLLVPTAWACEERALDALLERFAAPQTLAAKLPYRHPDGAYLGQMDGVAVLYNVGVTVKEPGPLARFFHLTDYATLRRDLQVALDDRAIDAIALYVDSPGGEANGADELAHAIFAARRKKPIHAFVSGMAASAGYWIASAAEQVVVSEGAMLGSIGVSMTAP